MNQDSRLIHSTSWYLKYTVMTFRYRGNKGFETFSKVAPLKK